MVVLAFQRYKKKVAAANSDSPPFSGGLRRHRRAGSNGTTVEFVFKGTKLDADPSLTDAMVTQMNAAITAGDVSVSLTVGGEEVTAAVTKEASRSSTTSALPAEGLAAWLELLGIYLYIIVAFPVLILCAFGPCICSVCCCCSPAVDTSGKKEVE